MLKKTFLAAIVLLTFASCSMFFDRDKTGRDGIGINALALADGSGYLSTDNYNEITPFIFKNTNNGKKYLFFSSDRGGSYDIYYAEMDTDGKFSRPVKMTNTVNTTDQEYSPVLIYAPDSSYVYHLYMSFCRVATNTTALVTYQLDSSLGVSVATDTGFALASNSVATLVQKSSDYYLSISSGNGYWEEYYWYYMNGGWDYSSPSQNYPVPGNSVPVESVTGFETYESEETGYWFLYTIQTGGKSQICFGGMTNYYGYNFYTTDPFRSVYNDLDVTLDPNDYKIYFASDRYGKGNYDLYRYNLVRYDMVRAPFMIRPNVTNCVSNVNFPVELYWETVPGAAFYRVLMSSDFGNTYVNIGTVTETFYIGTINLQTGDQYYYRIEAVNDWGVSDSYEVYVSIPMA